MELHHHDKQVDELNDDDLNIEFKEEDNEPYNWDEEFSKNTTDRDESAQDISKDFKQLEQIKTTTTNTTINTPTTINTNNTTIDDQFDPKANLISSSSSSSSNIKKNNQDELHIEEEEEDHNEAYETVKKQWDDVQLLRQQQQYGQQTSQVCELNSRELNISYEDTIKYYKKLKMNTELDVARDKLTNSPSNSMFSKIFSCFSNSDNETIRKEKEFLIALTQIPLNHEIEEHERQLFTIYKKITGDKQNCPSIGPHWEAIGFQGNDPKTDLRGVGMLGILQLLFFVYSDEKTTQDIYSLSQTQSFPMAVVSLNITQMILKMLIEGKLKSLIKKYEDSVSDTFNIAYSSAFYRFYLVWKRGQKRIIDFDNVKKDLIIQVNKNLNEIINEYTSMVLKREINVTNKDEIIEFQ